jgi:hypothetical protein
VLHRFVEEQELRLLGKPKRDLDALTFAPAELIENAVAERTSVGEIHGFVNGSAIARLQAAEHSQERGSALFNELFDGEGKGNIDVLRDEGNGTCDGALLHIAKNLPAQAYFAGCRSESACDQAQQSRFADAVGADKGDRIAIRDARVDVDEDPAITVTEANTR